MCIYLMDCTLRDGGYINNWNFGKKVIHNMIEEFVEASIDLVECGFFTDQPHNSEQSLFEALDEIKDVLPRNKKSTEYVVMINCGEYDIRKLAPCDNKSISGIRVAFYAHQVNQAVSIGKQVQKLGYKLFFQPMCTEFYTDEELLNLIDAVNHHIHPFAFYIVDSFGTMSGEVVEHLSFLIHENLDKKIKIGFHAHNNLQLAYSNAKKLISLEMDRDLIIDATISGIGRGAGNLNMELITQYLNARNSNYNLNLILGIYDHYISDMQSKYKWGYSIPYFLAATIKCHPNYANFLIKKGLTSTNEIRKILISIPDSQKMLFSKHKINEIYNNYVKHLQSEELRAL